MYSTDELPRELNDRVRGELESGEQILWIGQPIRRFFTASSIVPFLFAIPWTAFAVFWICAASGFKVPDFSRGGFRLFPLFGLPFVLIGIGMMCSPLWSYRKGLKTVYVITDRRAITFDAGWTTTIRTYLPGRLQNIYRRERRDGTGDIVLDQPVFGTSKGGQQTQYLGFLNVREPKKVEQMLRKLAERDTSTPPRSPL